MSDTAEDNDPALRAADGRMPGRRGLATRQKLLDCTAEMLRTTSYRDLKVVDIARKVGTSPATFYQYFPDVESAILVLAEDMVSEGAHHFADIVADASWKSKTSYDAALSLADEILAFWDEHRVVIRVVDLATEEGDRRFANVRVRLLNDLNNNIAAAVAAQRNAGRVPDELDPFAIAGVLVSMLVHVAAHRVGFEFWGVNTADLRTTMARIVYWSISGQKPPSP